MHYLKFLFKSTNAHGVHSPFVYDLVTQCFYKKNIKQHKFNSNKTKIRHQRIINNFIEYYKIESALLNVEDNHFITQLPNFNNLKLNNMHANDLVYIDTENFSQKPAGYGLDLLKETGVMIVENPYQNKELWHQLLNNAKARIVVQTYFFGFIFPRKNQVKEHFYIRI